MSKKSIFASLVRDASEGLVMKPRVMNYFYHAEFPEEFTVAFRNEGKPREPDGFFHPSTHPTMPVRQLYYYMVAKDDPSYWAHEQLDYRSRVSVTMGTALHELFEMAFKEMGMLTEPEGTCLACGKKQPDECSEHGVLDLVNNTRGHMDGITTNFSRLGTAGFDLKTSNNNSLSRIEDHDLEGFRKKWPYYYGQAQSYMISAKESLGIELKNFIFLFVGLGFPWEIREFIVPYDEEYCEALKAKYQKVLRHVEMGEPPAEVCCQSKAEANKCLAVRCPVRELMLR